MRKIRLQKTATDRLRERFDRELNEAQRAAATAPDGFNLILAGPGSGKTRVITYRVAYLIATGVPAEAILLVTFTRRAAREMVGRLESLVGPKGSRVWAGTFHHVGHRILRMAGGAIGLDPNFTILDSEDSLDLIKLAMADAGLDQAGRGGPKPAAAHHLISFAANVGRPLAEVVADQRPDLLAFVDRLAVAAAAYARRKRAARCVDYDDLLTEWARLIAEVPAQREALGRRFRHILVDEMQDTNRLQVEIVEAVARAGAGNLTAVGDDEQSIYRFRGAHYDNILKFVERNAGARLFKLETNYRSTPEIVALTSATIARNASGFPKALESARPTGPRPLLVPTADPYEEAELLAQQVIDWREAGVAPPRIAILYRNHHDSILLQNELVERGVAYQVRSGLRFFEQAHIKDVLAYLRVVFNPRDEPAWSRLLQLLPGIGPAKAAALLARVATAAEPWGAIESAESMAIVPPKGRGEFAGFVADLRALRACGPESNPAAGIAAVLRGGYSAIVRSKYERPDNRIADVEQLAVLAARYDRLDAFLAHLVLAGDVYGADQVAADSEPEEAIVLSTIHQAKGLEWSRVGVLRLVEPGFPSERSLNEPGGEEEERRIFYVAVSRAMDELVLTYPLTLARPGAWGTQVSVPSRFVTEIDPALFEAAVVETDNDLAWSSGPRAPKADGGG